MLPPLRTGPWRLSELSGIEKNGLKVFSCFCCGGGSSMGYKLAGYEVLGGVEIDPDMQAIYERNQKPRFLFRQPIQEFRLRDDLPPELYQLDVLDGSPPCSSFSMSGDREKMWGEEKKFREGQAKQILDDLFFHYIDLAAKLRPKIVVAENVKGLVLGNARGYVKWIFEKFEEAGYDVQLFLLNSCRMGVPQARERTFFIARRRDLNLPAVSMSFTEPPIPIARAIRGCDPASKSYGIGKQLPYWEAAKPGESLSKYHPKKHLFNHGKCHPARPAKTICASNAYQQYHWAEPRSLTSHELLRVQTFPEDYEFLGLKPGYVFGMSVPPFMMQRVATNLAKLLLP